MSGLSTPQRRRACRRGAGELLRTPRHAVGMPARLRTSRHGTAPSKLVEPPGSRAAAPSCLPALPRSPLSAVPLGLMPGSTLEVPANRRAARSARALAARPPQLPGRRQRAGPPRLTRRGALSGRSPRGGCPAACWSRRRAGRQASRRSLQLLGRRQREGAPQRQRRRGALSGCRPPRG